MIAFIGQGVLDTADLEVVIFAADFLALGIAGAGPEGADGEPSGAGLARLRPGLAGSSCGRRGGDLLKFYEEILQQNELWRLDCCDLIAIAAKTSPPSQGYSRSLR